MPQPTPPTRYQHNLPLMNLEGIEQDPQTKKVHCQVCKEEDPLQLGTWMLKKSLTKHLDSNKVQHEEQATAEQMHLEQVYHAAPVSPIDSFLDMDLRPPSGMFDMPDTNHCAPCHWNEPPIPISMNPIYEDEFRAMLLDILDNLPHLHMSSNQLQMTLWVLKESGVDNVPFYNSFQKMQTKLCKLCGSELKPSTSSIGNHFYVNNICESVAHDFGNPEIAKHLHFYPEETTGPISEVWQAEHWKEFKPSELTPMFSHGLQQFYIDEVAQLDNGNHVIPRNWIICGGQLTADCSKVTISMTGWHIESTLVNVVPATAFQWNYHDVVVCTGEDITWTVMPNPLCELTRDEDLYCDDVSGNKSKQYNKHINMYMQEYFVCFVSTSPNATSLEQFSALKDQINTTQTNPIHCYNAATGWSCRVILQVPSLPVDNPQQSEESSHMGGNANHGCHKCTVGGPHEYTESDEGYHALYFAGEAWNAEENLEEQIRLATYGVEKPIANLQTATGTKDKKAHKMKSQQPGQSSEAIVEELQQWLILQPGDKVNPLLFVAGLNPTQDTPVEILHTILLGIIKYVWHMLHTSWSEADHNLFAIHLQSTDLDGLTVPPIHPAYMIQYHNNLNLVTPGQFALVKAVGALGVMLWYHEINNMDEYLSDLEILIGNVLNAFGDIDPAKIIIKIKLHLLPHLVKDICHFGLAIQNSTEVFECFNAIFCLCSILSNHLAPSCDIASKFASMDWLKHILSGGYWQEDGEWVQASECVLQLLHSQPVVQCHLGWVPPIKIGKAKFPPCGFGLLGLMLDILTDAPWRHAHCVVAQSGDKCHIGSWIFAHPGGIVSSSHSEMISVQQQSLVIRCIAELIVPEISSATLVLTTIELFHLGEEQHPDFDMPILHCPINQSKKIVLINFYQDILFIFSAQHDCHMNNLLQKALPHELVAPVPLYQDQQAHHHAIMATLRAKWKATLAAKKAKMVIKEQHDSNGNNSDNGELEDASVLDEQSQHVLGK
ncbi:hypothetical protein L208DRAFT_1421556 [Tricholoma matsutake]|nr:hypothetical protein L208DRAFT_1421556 [Tricholoma matsutake 945]